MYKHEVLYKVLVKGFNDFKQTEEVAIAFDGVTESTRLQDTPDYKS